MNYGDEFAATRVGREAWFRHIREALDAADLVARHLVTCSEVASDAFALLARLEAIRGEVDGLHCAELAGPFELAPQWRGLFGEPCA